MIKMLLLTLSGNIRIEEKNRIEEKLHYDKRLIIARTCSRYLQSVLSLSLQPWELNSQKVKNLILRSTSNNISF